MRSSGAPLYLYLYSLVTLQPTLSVRPSIGRTVMFHFFYDFTSLTPLLLPEWSSDLKYGPCPPTRDFGSRVSGLVFLRSSFLHSLLSPFNLYSRLLFLSLGRKGSQASGEIKSRAY